jgi:hypothetical protein
MTDEKKIPALFATIHHRSESRPNGYTADDIFRMNLIANGVDPDDPSAVEAWKTGDRGDEPTDPV